jgi:hypothetical protein
MTEERAEYQSGQDVAVIAQEVREVDFYGDSLTIVLVDNVPYVVVRPIADFLGVEWTGQFQRIQRDEILNEEKRLVVITSADGRRREMVALPLEMLPGWLFGISGSRLKKPEMAEKLKRYRRECLHVIQNTLTSFPMIRMIRWKGKVLHSGNHSLGVLSLCG